MPFGIGMRLFWDDIGAQRGDKKLTIDPAHLLCKHDCRCAIVGAADTRDPEKIVHPRKVAAPASGRLFLFVYHIRVVVVSRSDDWVCTDLQEGLEGLGVSPVLHQPTGRFRAKVDTDDEDKGGDEGGSELQAPGDIAGVFDDDVGAEACPSATNAYSTAAQTI